MSLREKRWKYRQSSDNWNNPFPICDAPSASFLDSGIFLISLCHTTIHDTQKHHACDWLSIQCFSDHTISISTIAPTSPFFSPFSFLTFHLSFLTSRISRFSFLSSFLASFLHFSSDTYLIQDSKLNSPSSLAAGADSWAAGAAAGASPRAGPVRQTGLGTTKPVRNSPIPGPTVMACMLVEWITMIGWYACVYVRQSWTRGWQDMGSGSWLNGGSGWWAVRRVLLDGSGMYGCEARKRMNYIVVA